MSLSRPDRDEKAKRALLSLKRKYADKERVCDFYKERCNELQQIMARERVKDLPRAARDPTKYSGNELIERAIVIDRLMRELAESNAENKRLMQVIEGQGMPFSGEDSYGTRFASQLEFGPTSTYK